MKFLPLAPALLLVGSLAPTAWSAEPHFHGAAPAYETGYHGYSYSGEYSYGDYGYGNGSCQGCGWLQPGCCPRAWTPYDNVWDGYCNERLHGWGSRAGRGHGRSCGASCAAPMSYSRPQSCTSSAEGQQHSNYAPQQPATVLEASPPTLEHPSSLDAPAPPAELSTTSKPQPRSSLRVIRQTR